MGQKDSYIGEECRKRGVQNTFKLLKIGQTEDRNWNYFEKIISSSFYNVCYEFLKLT